MDLRRITIFAFILLFILFLASKYAFTGAEKSVTIHSPQRNISKELSEPNKSVFRQTQVEHVAVTEQSNSLEEIKGKYKRKFEELQAKTTKQIDALVENAIHDFQVYLSEESHDDSIRTLYQSYSSEGKKIEQQTEESFQVLYKELLTELVQNGYSEDEAQEFKLEYEQQKEDMKSEILKKAMSVVSQ